MVHSTFDRWTRVAPLAGAWIEILTFQAALEAYIVAPLAGAWIEMLTTSPCRVRITVAPLAGAWIEIVRFGRPFR